MTTHWGYDLARMASFTKAELVRRLESDDEVKGRRQIVGSYRKWRKEELQNEFWARLGFALEDA